MRKEDLCPGKSYKIWERAPKDVEVVGDWFSARPLRVKRIRMKCELCGRRVMSSVLISDNDIIHSIPPHKPKGWWKRKNKRKSK